MTGIRVKGFHAHAAKAHTHTHGGGATEVLLHSYITPGAYRGQLQDSATLPPGKKPGKR